MSGRTSRRTALGLFAAGGLGAATVNHPGWVAVAQAPAAAPDSPAQAANRERRLKWWHDARFGMFIHWGLYSVIGRHEWVMENEAIPVVGVRGPRQALPAEAERRPRLGAAGPPRRPEVHGDDDQAPRGLLPLRHPDDELLRTEAGAWARSRPGVRGRGAGGGTARRLLLLAHGLAPPGRRALCDRRAGPPPLRGLRPRARPRAHDQLREDRHPLVRRRLAARCRRVGVAADERHGLQAPARHRRQQPQQAARRLHHARAADPGGRSGLRLGVVHDDERELGLPRGRRRLEDAEAGGAEPHVVLPGRRELPAQHRAARRRLGARGVVEDTRHGRGVASAQRRVDVRGRPVPAKPVELRDVQPERPDALHARPRLARRHRGDGRPAGRPSSPPACWPRARRSASSRTSCVCASPGFPRTRPTHR